MSAFPVLSLPIMTLRGLSLKSLDNSPRSVIGARLAAFRPERSGAQFSDLLPRISGRNSMSLSVIK
jgi:hypothetical protein